MVTQSSVSNYIHTKISFDSGTKVAVVTQYRISYYFHATVSFNCGTKVAVVTRYQLPNYFHITTYPLTPLHKSSPPPSAFQFLFLHKPSIEVTKVTESQNSNYIHTTCHVCRKYIFSEKWQVLTVLTVLTVLAVLTLWLLWMSWSYCPFHVRSDSLLISWFKNIPSKALLWGGD